MANKNDRMVVAYYANEAAATNAAEVLQAWDTANREIKLGAIAIIRLDPKTGELEAKEVVGQRKTKSGALWGTAVGVAAGLLTGGLALIPAALLGAGGGSMVGAMYHKKVGVSDSDREELMTNLRAGGAALVVMADDFEVDATKREMARVGGKAEVYEIPTETVEAITEAAEAQAEAVEAVDEAVEEVAEETEETAAEVALDMPELAPEDATAVAKIVAATNLSSEDAAKLHAAGVDKASTLLVLASTPQGRRELGEATGLSNATILAGVKKMDLMRIRGVGVKHGALLLAAGVDTVPELAQRNPKNLHAALAVVNADKHIVADMPMEAEVVDWVRGPKSRHASSRTERAYAGKGVLGIWQRFVIATAISRDGPGVAEGALVRVNCRVGIKRMKTRWGRCSIAARCTWLDLELAKMPPLAYIAVHEMVQWPPMTPHGLPPPWCCPTGSEVRHGGWISWRNGRQIGSRTLTTSSAIWSEHPSLEISGKGTFAICIQGNVDYGLWQL